MGRTNAQDTVYTRTVKANKFKFHGNFELFSQKDSLSSKGALQKNLKNKICNKKKLDLQIRFCYRQIF
jgi:hypothetical protein